MFKKCKQWITNKIQKRLGSKEIIDILHELNRSINSLQRHLTEIKHDPFNLAREKAGWEAVEFIQTHPSALIFNYNNQLAFWKYALSKAAADGLFFEFGVFSGASINHFAAIRQDVTFHGFDSFEGLPEDWSGHQCPKEQFNRDGNLPIVSENVMLHKGWFDKSIPVFLSQHENQKVSFIHIDCDIYSSAKTVFDCLEKHITTGTVIVFDEYLCYPNWREHEHRAFSEFVEKTNTKYRFIAFCSCCAAVVIDSIGNECPSTH